MTMLLSKALSVVLIREQLMFYPCLWTILGCSSLPPALAYGRHMFCSFCASLFPKKVLIAGKLREAMTVEANQLADLAAACGQLNGNVSLSPATVNEAPQQV